MTMKNLKPSTHLKYSLALYEIINKFFANRIDIPTTEIPRRTFEAKPTSMLSNIGERSSRMRNVMLRNKTFVNEESNAKK
jgi:hypothetical protein